MRAKLWLAGGLLVAVGGFALSWTRGQERPQVSAPTSRPGGVQPASYATPENRPPARDLSKLSPLQQQMFLSAQRGSEWIYRANGTQGRFLHGYLPALKAPMQGDHFLRQAGAAFALARAARTMGDERYAARATQAVLALLGETATDPKEPTVRSTILPSAAISRMGAAGLLVLAIHELPAPQPDVLDQAEQLCSYIRKQQRTDGSLACGDDTGVADDPGSMSEYPGLALHGLARSQRLRPASWKLDVLKKAVAFYHPWWKAHRSIAFVQSQTAAYTEAFLLTKENPFAACVTDMNDWLCGMQYDHFDPRHPLWEGGFMSWADGKPVAGPPDVGSAASAECLVEASRVARATADLARYRRYSEAVERCLQFVTTLQYTDANTTHFAPWYKPTLLGAFYASEQDGNLRIDYTQHAICAMVQYLQYVTKVQ
jgi:hypothetical protein